jgi:hypothetical protein
MPAVTLRAVWKALLVSLAGRWTVVGDAGLVMVFLFFITLYILDDVFLMCIGKRLGIAFQFRVYILEKQFGLQDLVGYACHDWIC